jgi:ribonuclease J
MFPVPTKSVRHHSTASSSPRYARPHSTSKRSAAAPKRKTRSRSTISAPRRQHEGSVLSSVQPERPVTHFAARRNTLYIIPLGGFEEVGRNCFAVQYNNDIIIIDMGLMFPEEGMLGVDYVIPDISPLRGKEKMVRAVLITHAHYDHIAALPHLLPRLGNPPVFGTLFTVKLIQKRQEDFPQYAKPHVKEIKPKQVFRVGSFEVEPFHVNHTIPQSVGYTLRTPAGSLAYTGDYKFDTDPVNDAPADENHIRRLGKKGITVLFGDSTGAEIPGHSLPEKVVKENLNQIFVKAKQRIIAATFASLINRLQQMIDLAQKYGRKVAIDGFSMKTNVEIAREIGYLHVPQNLLITPEESTKLPPQKVLVLCTGAQGEDKAVLMRIVNGEHRSLRIEKGDTVIFSSSVVPGNELTVQKLKDLLYKQGAEVYHYRMMDIHASGHGHQEDLKKMLRLFKPRFFIPAHGNYSMRVVNARLAREVGIPQSRIFVPENGQVIEVKGNKVRILKKRYPIRYVFVDGLGVGDVEEVVLRDRQILASDGMVVTLVMVDGRTGAIVGEPDIISRGFVHTKHQEQLMREMRRKIKEIIQGSVAEPNSPPNWTYLRNKVRDDLGLFLFQKTERRPMILPVIIEV